jgi:hypothetical protein
MSGEFTTVSVHVGVQTSKNKFSQSLENNDKFDSNSGLQNLGGRGEESQNIQGTYNPWRILFVWLVAD